MIIRNKVDLDENKAIQVLESWLDINYYDIAREPQYKDIQPQINVEKYIQSSESIDLMDYKIFCFAGEPKYVQIDIDRYTNHKRLFYDINWDQQTFTIIYPRYSGSVEKPKNFSDMLRISRILSKGYPFSRIDLYNISGKILFGEITFHPEAGFGAIIPDKWDYNLGDLLRIELTI